MRVTIIAVGRERRGPTRELFEAYRTRCPWPIRLIDVAPRPTGEVERRLAEEAERLLRAIPQGAAVIALDEQGELLDSRDFAARIAAWRADGRTDLAFLIGGPDGLAAEVRGRADLALAFGRMTWPHLLVRVMLAEQLYRAASILAGHPYHRE
jgi:23S rRNA (pseudouridine1915-N3)-methyltransferase